MLHSGLHLEFAGETETGAGGEDVVDSAVNVVSGPTARPALEPDHGVLLHLHSLGLAGGTVQAGDHLLLAWRLNLLSSCSIIIYQTLN